MKKLPKVQHARFQEMPPRAEEWGRFPRPGATLRGLTKSHLYALLQKKLIKTVEIKMPDKNRGVRLIHLPSLDEYLGRLYAEQHPGQDEGSRSK